MFFERQTCEDKSLYKFKLSSLHARIRIFECLLHLQITKNGNRNYIKKKIHSREHNDKMQNVLKYEMDTIIDIQKSGIRLMTYSDISGYFFVLKNYYVIKQD